MPTIEQEYVETHAQSRARHERAVRSMPNGVAHDGRVLSPFPFYVERADGARKWDVDGHAYLDCWSGHGALILGHNHPAIVTAITEQAKRGLHYSACHELEVRWAELIRACVPGAEKVRFALTGTETTALAVRVARAATGRPKVVKFEGLHLAMLLNGVDYSRGSAIGWLNAAMTDADIDQMVDAFDRSLDRLRCAGALA
ncbi:MAG TPA: aminotransferase class III-fold pyridoxal phosphate-dependent enzyme [Candidatus Elarobacter sp.]|nr:aminotransferase class III-fold pyridoxal phosphate-dependent enzyme [Candidatus Elarobacter sp.]